MPNYEQDQKLLSMFAKTRALIETNNRENAMCTCVIDGAECYCNAIILLLNRNYVYPAMALMRCLCELTVKLIWCLQCPDDTDKEQDRKTVDDKPRRWEKSTLAQNIKVLEEWKQVDPQNNKIDDKIKELKKKYDDIDIKEMPCCAQLLEKLPGQFSEIPLELYKGFNNAVHLDVNSLVEIHLHNDKPKVDSNSIRKSCLVLAKLITGVIELNQKSADS